MGTVGRALDSIAVQLEVHLCQTMNTEHASDALGWCRPEAGVRLREDQKPT